MSDLLGLASGEEGGCGCVLVECVMVLAVGYYGKRIDNRLYMLTLQSFYLSLGLLPYELINS